MRRRWVVYLLLDGLIAFGDFVFQRRTFVFHSFETVGVLLDALLMCDSSGVLFRSFSSQREDLVNGSSEGRITSETAQIGHRPAARVSL